MNDLEIKLKKIISNILDCNTSTLDKNSGLLNHPNWDSINHILIIVEIESVFNIEFEDQEIEMATTLGLILTTLIIKHNL